MKKFLFATAALIATAGVAVADIKQSITGSDTALLTAVDQLLVEETALATDLTETPAVDAADASEVITDTAPAIVAKAVLPGDRSEVLAYHSPGDILDNAQTAHGGGMMHEGGVDLVIWENPAALTPVLTAKTFDLDDVGVELANSMIDAQNWSIDI